jgi:hypothetical protein
MIAFHIKKVFKKMIIKLSLKSMNNIVQKRKKHNKIYKIRSIKLRIVIQIIKIVCNLLHHLQVLNKNYNLNKKKLLLSIKNNNTKNKEF